MPSPQLSTCHLLDAEHALFTASLADLTDSAVDWDTTTVTSFVTAREALRTLRWVPGQSTRCTTAAHAHGIDRSDPSRGFSIFSPLSAALPFVQAPVPASQTPFPTHLCCCCLMHNATNTGTKPFLPTPAPLPEVRLPLPLPGVPARVTSRTRLQHIAGQTATFLLGGQSDLNGDWTRQEFTDPSRRPPPHRGDVHCPLLGLEPTGTSAGGAVRPTLPALPAALGSLYSQMVQTTDSVAPVTFLNLLREVNPQFAEFDRAHSHGGLGRYAQQGNVSLSQHVIKRSPTLGRDANYTQESRITRLPAYLFVHMRCLWRVDINKKAKVMVRAQLLHVYLQSRACTPPVPPRLPPRVATVHPLVAHSPCCQPHWRLCGATTAGMQCPLRV
ncbi:hypothetical protein GGX14DRAFT_595387 [Mycena pura]|uniref:ubiquitinyl hydrolase 1 n=1 Tax=Mycena pura TaxID=153505 RepID=A0AAD6VP11_9AGAR|nr:hypothetical protein GGX14DRAFT_595387 [Mycena pura]